MATDTTPRSTAPGLTAEQGRRLIDLLRLRLYALNDLHLTLKHIHWNVVGPHFVAVHELLEPQVDRVREMADDVAERIAALGGVAKGTPGALVSARTGEDRSIGRGEALAHLGALDGVYTGVVEDVREAVARAGEIDPATAELLGEQLCGLERFQWFVRAHLEASGGSPRTSGAADGRSAAERATD
ncbi:Dps family protein [Streptomyces sp. BBFR102]|uniref:Dps family protein n=1 Tax=Streptomyces sp. BBFR102 TaxID=3448171 RepID=UPI003F536BFD